MEALRLFLLAYFDAQYEMLTAHQPEVVGHFDLCLLWTPTVSLRSTEMEGVWEKVERNLRYAAGYGVLFEANAAAIRKGWGTSYPSRDILQVSFHQPTCCD
jgi:histidinol-phosphatase (PHP family)